MSTNIFTPYSAVIRTLGKANEKFEQEIASLLNQTIKPEQILVYIPHGYEIPKPFPGSEAITYIRCDKGMITQRSLPFTEVTTQHILFLDDDVYLAPESVEILQNELKKNDGDCIVANTFPNHKATVKKKLRMITSSLTCPDFFSKYAFKIRKSGHYSYANNPSSVMLSQSGAGPCALIKKEWYNKISFETERWLEDFGYALGEDLLMFNKLYQAGGKLLVSYDSGVVHLDAQTGHSTKNIKEKDFSHKQIWFLLWHRTQYSTASTKWQKINASLHYTGSWLFFLIKELITGIRLRNLWQVKNRINALSSALKIIKEEPYVSLPPFKITHNS